MLTAAAKCSVCGLFKREGSHFFFIYSAFFFKKRKETQLDLESLQRFWMWWIAWVDIAGPVLLFICPSSVPISCLGNKAVESLLSCFSVEKAVGQWFPVLKSGTVLMTEQPRVFP